MKAKLRLQNITRYFIYTLLTCILCLGCLDNSLIEEIGKDEIIIQNEFEKCASWISVDTVIIDTTIIRGIKQGKYKYYRVKFVVGNEANH